MTNEMELAPALLRCVDSLGLRERALLLLLLLRRESWRSEKAASNLTSLEILTTVQPLLPDKTRFLLRE